MEITRSVVSERDRALLSGSYDAYHAQASRRIHLLRRRLQVTTPKGRKYSPKDPITADNVAKNAEWVQLLLASAERAWASAMSMKTTQSQENTQKPIPGTTKRQIVSRLRRAVSYAENLVSTLQDRPTSKASSSDTLEAKAYRSMLKGTTAFEKSQWKSCLQNYSLVHIVYTTLGADAKTDIYKDLLSTYVDPSLRYAAYQLKMPRTKPVKSIVLENFPEEDSSVRSDLINIEPRAFDGEEDSTSANDSSRVGPSHITWRTRKVMLEDAAISQAIGAAEEREHQLEDLHTSYKSGKSDSSALVSAYDDIITARQDAADATKTAIDELAAEGVDPGDSRIQSLQITRTAVNYAVIEWRIGRNRILCGPDDGLLFEPFKHKQSQKLGKDGNPRQPKLESTGRKISRLRERSALYDSILQSLESVKELPGVIADEAFVQELDAKHSYFRALKCLAVGRSHAVNGSTLNALALYARASSLVDSAATSIPKTSDSTSAPKLTITSPSLKTLQSHLSALVTQFRALADLKSLSTAPTTSKDASTFQPPLLETLHRSPYPSSGTIDLTNLVNYPPKLQPIPVKPLFFDLAWNYIQYPGHERTTTTNVNGEGTGDHASKGSAGEEEKPARRGWFGFSR